MGFQHPRGHEAATGTRMFGQPAAPGDAPIIYMWLGLFWVGFCWQLADGPAGLCLSATGSHSIGTACTYLPCRFCCCCLGGQNLWGSFILCAAEHVARGSCTSVIVAAWLSQFMRPGCMSCLVGHNGGVEDMCIVRYAALLHAVCLWHSGHPCMYV